jgi:hypothetical protein
MTNNNGLNKTEIALSCGKVLRQLNAGRETLSESS